jgi:hypothetical protein
VANDAPRIDAATKAEVVKKAHLHVPRKWFYTQSKTPVNRPQEIIRRHAKMPPPIAAQNEKMGKPSPPTAAQFSQTPLETDTPSDIVGGTIAYSIVASDGFTSAAQRTACRGRRVDPPGNVGGDNLHRQLDAAVCAELLAQPVRAVFLVGRTHLTSIVKEGRSSLLETWRGRPDLGVGRRPENPRPSPPCTTRSRSDA